MEDVELTALAERLVAVEGVVAVVLGGSRARGTHRPDSDVDLGLYYRGQLDVAGLRRLAAEVADEPAEVTEPGGWGPWVNGGGWLDVRGQRVDWIYRDLDRVRRVWDDCCAGRYEVDVQPGHPLGFYSHAYAGEVALCRVLADPSGELTELRAETAHYPDPLADALVQGLWEADFTVDLASYGAKVRGPAHPHPADDDPAGRGPARTAATGTDPAYAAGCLFRAVGVMCHALHGRHRAWLINEKGMVGATGRLPGAPPGFTEQAQSLLAGVGSTPDHIARTVARAREMVARVRTAVNG